MERESFEDEETAAFLNANFVPIKVDREERPDLDSIYMDAVQSMTGHGRMAAVGVPHARRRALLRRHLLSPKEPRHGMPSFRQVLEGSPKRGGSRRDDVERRVAGSSRRSPVAASLTASPGAARDAMTLARGDRELRRSFDQSWGGFGRRRSSPSR